ncbi:MFS transporter [Herbivorax sp. ANBcel31]|uniref:MFS transporter n=1 Tax=Herbivorax sp. ANBcel31 TaxID=3069754 RepID=UPI0027AEA741|nr:MFS transporter [Herbivorax sp. ANBcel31]MDQ2085496.1 MFS transporter [Herbivorax sp. ANBcel31]
MKNTQHMKNYPFIFPAFYVLIYMALAVFSVFLPVYLDSLEYSGTQIGILLAIGSFVAIFSQPFWGIACDRAKTKNSVIKLLLIMTSFIMLLFYLSESFYYLFFILVILSFFQTPVFPISDAITLEYMAPTRWKFGPIRLAGTMGYALMAVIAGAIIDKNISGIFFISFLLGLVTFSSVFKIPKVKGHQATGRKISIIELFKNKELMIFMGFTVAIHSTLAFYNTFFGIYYTGIGADSSLLGWAIFIASVSEVFFLLWGDRVIDKLGIKSTLLGAGLICAIRWGVLGLSNNIYIIMLSQVLHGFTFIVLAYSMATYINNEVPKELRASGQTLNAVICLGLSRIIGSIGGGIFSDFVGVKQVFLYASLIIFLSLCIFKLIFKYSNLQKT